MTEYPVARCIPVLPLRDIVVFPHMIVPLFVGREKSVRALEEVMKDDKQILLVDPEERRRRTIRQPDDIYTVGTVATVLQLLKLPDGTVKVLVEGSQRAAHHSASPTTRISSRPRPSRSTTTSGDAEELEALIAHGGQPVRAVHQAQQEDPARGAGLGQPDRGAGASSPTPSPRICR